MRTKIIIFNICVMSAVILSSTVYGQAKWELYDDFNSGTIDTNKWIIDDSSAVITNENNQAKFMHQSGNANDSSYLEIAESAGTISGVKVTITVASCSGDVKSRIVSNFGRMGSDSAFAEHAVRPDNEQIANRVLILGPAPDFTFNYMLFSGVLHTQPQSIVGTPFTLSTITDHRLINFWVDGEGELDYLFPSNMEAVEESDIFVGIGTRSSSGVGECTVYFDDVYVQRKQSFNWTFIVPVLSKNQQEKALE